MKKFINTKTFIKEIEWKLETPVREDIYEYIVAIALGALVIPIVEVVKFFRRKFSKAYIQ